MEHCRADRKRTQRCGNYNNVLEPDYEVVDNQEEVVNVRIHPARPISDEGEYADRSLPRSLSPHSPSPIWVHTDIPHRHPRRDAPNSTAPAINRDLKPGRQKKKFDKKAPPVPAGEEHSQRNYLPPPSAFTSELASRLSGMAVRDSSRNNKQPRRDQKEEFALQTKDSHSFERDATPQVTQRYSLDLESHNIGNSSSKNVEDVLSKRHHEWPQTREDYDQRDFVPTEKPQQICDDDWYVGACNRADAEHALHLVNKDGAFLVRDCSINTNSEPLVLVVYHEKKVYNVKIRFIESSSKFALGTGQHSKDMFDSVEDIIKFHSIFPITLISGRNMPGSKYPENCVLTCPVTKRDVDQLLQ